MPDRLIVSELRAEDMDGHVPVALTRALEDAGLDFEADGAQVVTNTKAGEPEEEARSYVVQELLVAPVPDQSATALLEVDPDMIHEIRSCSCPGFKYHQTPYAADLSKAPAEELQAIGECKHIEEVRKADRSDAARDGDQGGLDAWS